MSGGTTAWRSGLTSSAARSSCDSGGGLEPRAVAGLIHIPMPGRHSMPWRKLSGRSGAAAILTGRQAVAAS